MRGEEEEAKDQTLYHYYPSYHRQVVVIVIAFVAPFIHPIQHTKVVKGSAAQQLELLVGGTDRKGFWQIFMGKDQERKGEEEEKDFLL